MGPETRDRAALSGAPPGQVARLARDQADMRGDARLTQG
jgi:hypothetical protein